MPGLETSVVFQENDGLVQRLMNWAQTADEPLKTYAVGLLGGAMESQDIAANFKESNAELVPAMIQKLHQLKDIEEDIPKPQPDISEASCSIPDRPFKDIGREDDTSKASTVSVKPAANHDAFSDSNDSASKRSGGDSNEEIDGAPASKRQKTFQTKNPFSRIHHDREQNKHDMGETGASDWSKMSQIVYSSYSMYPLTVHMQQRLILQYLTPMGEYQELLSYVFEHKALDLIMHYIDYSKNKDVRLAFEATKFLAALLCHKKFAVEFITIGGVEKLLDIPRPSIAATGASMCLYYLAYFEDAMERVCLLPHLVLNKLVNFVLWLLECSHESGRCHATMFFGISFPFKVILELFDKHDGLRKMYNMASTLELLNSEEDMQNSLSEDEVFTSLQAARHVMVALRKYFEAHLCIKANELKRLHLNHDGSSLTSNIGEIPGYKATECPIDVIEENLELLLECMPLRMRWEPVANIVKLGGVKLLMRLVAMAADWNNYSGKAETIRSALDVLSICSVTPRVQLQLCDVIPVPDNATTPAMSILLGLADGEVIGDSEVQKSALRVIINCVCSPSSRYNNNHQLAKFISSSAKRKSVMRKEEELLVKLWENVRNNNGIMVLLKVLNMKTPITEADSIRVLACKALVGLARCDTVKQIISTMLMRNDAHLQQLVKEPVLQDKRKEHIKFCKYANELIERVAGKTQNTNVDASLQRIRRADVVAQTKIIYREKELLTLIHNHLQTIGMKHTAEMLQEEADLPRCPSPPQHPANLQLYSTPTTPRLHGSRAVANTNSKFSNVPTTPEHHQQQQRPALASTSLSNTPGTPSAPIKMNIISSKVNQQSPAVPSTSSAPAAFSRMTNKKVLQKLEVGVTASAGLPSLTSPSIVNKWQPKQENSMSLDKIITEYLRKQHAVCNNPVVTCPPFSLLEPHRCPVPKHRNSASQNMTARLIQREYRPRHGGADGMRCTRKFLYSRFRPIRSYRDQDEDGCFSCCAFTADEQNLLMGTYAGEMKMISLATSEETGAYVCHNSPITYCEPSPDGQLLLTCSSWGQPLSGLWNILEGGAFSYILP